MIVIFDKNDIFTRQQPHPDDVDLTNFVSMEPGSALSRFSSLIKYRTGIKFEGGELVKVLKDRERQTPYYIVE